ncbi:MAG: FecR family protein [Verrucomicrobiota bacterium]
MSTSIKALKSLLPLLAVTGLILPATTADAAKFKSAKVTKTVNDVRLLTGSQSARPANPGDTVTGSAAVQTGQRSRAELQFPDESLVRLGSNSVFSFLEGKRDVELEKGTLLMQVPKSLGRTQVKTAAVTAAITGTTILIEFVPAVLDELGNVIKPGIIKIIVIEGSLEFSLNVNPGQKMELLPGDMVVMSSTAQQLPQKFTVDLNRLVKTSNLIDGGMGPLPDVPVVQREIINQNNLKRNGQLLEVNVAGNRRGRIFPHNPPDRVIRKTRNVVNQNPNNRIVAPVIRRMVRPAARPGNTGPITPPAVNLPDRPPRDGGPSGPPNGATEAL